MSYANLVGRLERGVVVARRQLSVGNRAVWAVSVLLVLLTCPLDFKEPAAGLDPSWMAGLNMAVDEGKRFGSEIVYTYGPLGFLAWPGLWVSWLAVLAFVYSLAVYAAFAATLTWAIERSAGLLAAAVVGFLFLATIPSLEQMPLLLAIGWSFIALRSDRPRGAVTVLAVGGGLLCAIEPQVKLSIGPPCVLVCLLGLAGARAGRRQWGGFAAVAIGGFLVTWLLTGQGLGNLWDYLVNGIQIVIGYGEAMGYDAGKTWDLLALIFLGVGLVAAVSRGDFRDSRARWFAIGLSAMAAYVLYKYATTQFVGGPIGASLAALLAAFMMVPRPRRRAAAFLTASAVIGAIALHSYPSGARLDVLTNAKELGEAVELAIRPGMRQHRIDEARARVQAEFAITPPVLAALQGKSVAIEPWETGIAWAYQLDWHPFPVFQSYQAYTSKLDRLNAAALEDPDGPQVLLRTMPAGAVPLGGRPGFGARQPYWDPPEQNLATVCNFVPTLTEGTWQVLSRVPDRCGAPEPIGSQEAQPGEVVKVPQAGRNELIVLRLQGAEVEGIERLRSLFTRPRERWARLDGGRYGYRLVPGTSGDGLIISVDRSLDGGVDFVELPVFRNIAIDGADGPLTFAFYRIGIEPTGARPQS